MRHSTDATLSALDRLSGKCGPLSSLLNLIAQRIAPTATAQACGGVLCLTACSPIACSGGLKLLFKYYASTEANCDARHYSCHTFQCIC